MRWSLRLGEDAEGSLSVLCVARDAEGRWLAGRRAPWVATWPGRWALGAGGSVEVGEDPVEALTRELEEEWSVQPERLAVEALVSLPTGLVMLVGQAWLADGAQVERDAEHDAHAWWPAEPDGVAGGGRPGAAPHGHAARSVITFTRLKYLSFAHSGVYLALLALWLIGRPGDAADGARLGPRRRLDRDVAAVHRRRPAARDPALAGRDGGRRRRRRPVRRKHRLRRL